MTRFGIGAAALFAPAVAGAAEGGLPQLDPTFFASQLFWLAVFFVILYLVMARVALPRVGAALDARAEKLRDDLDEAARLKADTDKAIAEYEAALAAARAKAQATASEARDTAVREAAAARAKVEAEANDRTRAAEAAIAAARNRALAELDRDAGAVTATIVERLTGAAPAAGAVQAALGAARGS